MGLLNYTTSIDGMKTVGEIQRCLSIHGARQVMVGYGPDGQPEAVAFLVPTGFGERAYRLPANISAVEATLQAQHRKGKIAARFATPEQATRVAWRIVKDWVEAQMAIIESGMVAMEEVFLPYMEDGSGQTVYQYMQEQHLALPDNGRACRALPSPVLPNGSAPHPPK